MSAATVNVIAEAVTTVAGTIRTVVNAVTMIQETIRQMLKNKGKITKDAGFVSQ